MSVCASIRSKQRLCEYLSEVEDLQAIAKGWHLKSDICDGTSVNLEDLKRFTVGWEIVQDDHKEGEEVEVVRIVYQLSHFQNDEQELVPARPLVEGHPSIHNFWLPRFFFCHGKKSRVSHGTGVNVINLRDNLEGNKVHNRVNCALLACNQNHIDDFSENSGGKLEACN